MSRKLYIILRGGLGNQLFQFAFGLGLSRRCGCDVDFIYLPASGIFGSFPRDCLVSRLTNNYRFSFPSKLNSKILWFLVSRLHSFSGNLVYYEPHYHFWDDFINISPNRFFGSIVCGYYQSERYFVSVSEELRGILDLSKVCSSLISDNISLISGSKNSVSVHLRFGDYLKLSHIHPLCSREYFDSARSYIERLQKPCSYFVFSDDIKMAKVLLQGWRDVTFIHHSNSFDDMYLMSLCNHNIISNSSYSWWSAWLNGNKKKIVVAPFRHFSLASGICSKDLHPSSWHLL